MTARSTASCATGAQMRKPRDKRCTNSSPRREARDTARLKAQAAWHRGPQRRGLQCPHLAPTPQTVLQASGPVQRLEGLDAVTTHPDSVTALLLWPAAGGHSSLSDMSSAPAVSFSAQPCNHLNTPTQAARPRPNRRAFGTEAPASPTLRACDKRPHPDTTGDGRAFDYQGVRNEAPRASRRPAGDRLQAARVSEFQLMSQERQVFTFVVGEPGLQHVIPDMALHLCEDERDAPKGHACSLGENRLNPEVPLALSGEMLPCPWRPVSPWHESAAGPPVLVARPALVRQWAREEPGHRGTSALQSLRPRPCPTKAAITLMSRDSVAWRHRAGWGHRLGTQNQKLAASGLILGPDSRGDCPKAVPLFHRELVSARRCGGSPGLKTQ
ncbi:unnamed protein product [Rangifer tarandus platyrhynchus]|uniref:Uncharacterized protein n=2 Tax=Rangifer tarandus platyrhynchus TaxID=3082113 RepID=A0ACB0E9I7_RANTA|nr:unnamed protein product [Rangifer tarandus platyrhynchus]CAI9696876.1 unnamed protein product [Rangifer tarandus platyrhynchus]